MTEQWQIRRNGRVAGPVTKSQLVQLITIGRIRPDDEVAPMGTHSWGQWAKVKDTAELNTPPASPPVPTSKPAVRPTPPGSPPPLPRGSISKTPTSPPPVLRGRIVGRSAPAAGEETPSKDGPPDKPISVGRRLRPFLIGLAICVFTPICCCSGLAIRTSWVEARERAERKREEMRREQEREAQRSALLSTIREGHAFWDSGNKAQAVAKYRSAIATDERSLIVSIPSEERPTLYQRVIENELLTGNLSAAKQWMIQACANNIPLHFADPKAQEVLGEAKAELERRNEDRRERDREREAKRAREEEQQQERQRQEQLVRRPQEPSSGSWLPSFTSGGGKAVDQWLDQYEQIIERWEQRGSSMTLADVLAMSRENQALIAKAENMKTADKWSYGQQMRLSQLMSRAATAASKMSNR